MARKMDFGEIIDIEDMFTGSESQGLTDMGREYSWPEQAHSVYFLVGSSCIICKKGKKYSGF